MKMKRDYYHFIMFGSEGLEGYCVAEDPDHLGDGMIEGMKLRARFNSHRNINVYAFKADIKISEDLITEKFLSETKGIIKLF